MIATVPSASKVLAMLTARIDQMPGNRRGIDAIRHAVDRNEITGMIGEFSSHDQAPAIGKQCRRGCRLRCQLVHRRFPRSRLGRLHRFCASPRYQRKSSMTLPKAMALIPIHP